MASSNLCFELYEGGSKATDSFDVYLDGSTDAVENSYYYDSATFKSQLLYGTNGFSAWTETILPVAAKCYRIRILYNDSLRFCSAWFKRSNNGYADYLPYYGSNGTSNGIYRIPVASISKKSRILSGTTSLADIPSINKTIPCDIYLFLGGGYLSGGTTYPPIVGKATVNIGSNYSMYVPSSTSSTAMRNDISYCFNSHNLTNPEQEHSYFNNYGLDGPGMCVTLTTGPVGAADLAFIPQQGVICTGQMAESISPYAKEFANNGAMCLPVSEVISNGFYWAESSAPVPKLARFDWVKKRYSVIINTVFLTSGSVNSMFYRFSGDSKVFTTDTVSFPSDSKISGVTWHAYIYNLLGANYTSADLNKSVRVSIGGYITTVANYWYYRVIAGDGSNIKLTTRLTSNDGYFTTTMGKLDGAVVFFSKNNITSSNWLSKKKASDYNTITTHNETTTSLKSIGEFDY